MPARKPTDKTRTQTPAWLSAFNKAPIDALDTVFAQHLVMHFSDNLIPSPAPNLQGLKEFLTLLRTAFPDLEFTLQTVAGQGRTHVYTWAARGTHAGLFMRIKPTGRRVAFPGRFMLRHDMSGMVVELWSRTSLIATVAQLGMAPTGVG